MSCYAPVWVKRDQRRFPRTRLRTGRAVEILSAFCEASLVADARAFAALMRHVREIDRREETVVMVQVENEVGMLEDAREHGDAANDAFAAAVPAELALHLEREEATLAPSLRERWHRAGRRTGAHWTDTFGAGLETDELFTAFHYAKYVDYVARAGRAEHDVPMFVNAALNRPGHAPGRYPSGGPLPHLFDVWRAGAPSIDFFSPDIYFPNVAEWCDKYHEPLRNPLFIPEATNDAASALDVFYAIGEKRAIGYCPFSIESIADPRTSLLRQAYQAIGSLAPTLLEARERGATAGVLLDKETPRRSMSLGGYSLSFAHDYTWEWSPGAREQGPWPRGGALVIAVGSDEYLIAGSAIIVTFAPDSPGEPEVGIAAIDEGTFDSGRFRPGRRLNGDQTHQGRHLRLPPGAVGIQRVRLYRYG
jgi:hypothetical protein